MEEGRGEEREETLAAKFTILNTSIRPRTRFLIGAAPLIDIHRSKCLVSFIANNRALAKIFFAERGFDTQLLEKGESSKC